MMVFYYSIEVLATLTEFFILFSLLEQHETPKYPKRKQFLVKIALCFGMTLIVTGMNQISLFSYYTIMVTIICIMFLGKVLCDGTVLQNFTICVIFIMVLNIIDFATANLMASIGNNDHFFEQTFSTIGFARTSWVISMKLILIVIYLVYLKFVHSFQKGKTKYVKWVVAIAVLSFLCVAFIVNSLFADTTEKMRNAIIPAWIFIIGCLFIVFLLFKALFEDEKKKHDYELLAIQSKYLQDNYEALHKAQMANEQINHDFSNHLMGLKSLIRCGKYQEAIAYIEKVQKPITVVNDLTRAGEEIVDAILNTKEQLANNHEISIRIRADYPHGTNLESADICAILSNLLDNAIEACDKIEDVQKRFIHFSCGINKNVFIIKVENSVAEDPFEKNGRLVTSKKDKRMHGLGLKSIASAVDKYDGTLSYSCQDRVFTAIVTLFFTQVTN